MVKWTKCNHTRAHTNTFYTTCEVLEIEVENSSLNNLYKNFTYFLTLRFFLRIFRNFFDNFLPLFHHFQSLSCRKLILWDNLECAWSLTKMYSTHTHKMRDEPELMFCFKFSSLPLIVIRAHLQSAANADPFETIFEFVIWYWRYVTSYPEIRLIHLWKCATV